MKWFIIVLMLGTFPDGSKDTFLYFQPEFETVDECKDYVYHYSSEIRNQMMIEFQGKSIEMVYCVREDRIKDVLKVPGIDA